MSELTWYLSRATGVVSICLLTATVVLGLLTAGRGARPGHRTGVVMGLHRWLSLGMLAFLAAHVVTAVVDTYVDISWTAAVVPFTSAYEPLLVGLGTIALDIMVAVVVRSCDTGSRSGPGAGRTSRRTSCGRSRWRTASS